MDTSFLKHMPKLYQKLWKLTKSKEYQDKFPGFGAYIGVIEDIHGKTKEDTKAELFFIGGDQYNQVFYYDFKEKCWHIDESSKKLSDTQIISEIKRFYSNEINDFKKMKSSCNNPDEKEGFDDAIDFYKFIITNL